MPMSIKKILCALDLSDHSPQVADYASLIAKQFDAEVLCVYVAPTLSQYSGFKVPQRDIHTVVGEIVNGAQASMNAFISEHFEGVKTSVEVLVGYASEEILARAANVDLVILGTHGRRGIDRILFGSVAEKVVKNSPVPVLTIRPKN